MKAPKLLKAPCGRSIVHHSKTPTPDLVEEWKNKLRLYLTDKKLKYTEPRWEIAKSILETGGHLDAGQIVTNVRRNNPEIGPATVYRNIKLLCEAGLLVQSHQSIEGRALYELPGDEHHDHIVCLDCGHILEFHNDNLEKLQEEISTKLSFRLKAHKHVIYAKCTLLKE